MAESAHRGCQAPRAAPVTIKDQCPWSGAVPAKMRLCAKEQVQRRRRACCLPILLVAGLSGTAVAGEDQPRREVFSGVETTNNYTGVYAGGGYAFGEGLYGSGWRVRAVGAVGRYSYDGTLFESGSYVPTEFSGDVSFLSVQAGYQIRRGPLVVKAFAGIEAVDQQISPYDPGNSVQGTALGLRIALETWADLTGRWFLSADASFGTAFQEYWELTRIGYRLGPVLSAGLEGGVLGNREYNAGRGGGFVRAHFKAFEATVSGGFTGDYLLDEPSGYLALSLYRAF